jgi:hypothetical protein
MTDVMAAAVPENETYSEPLSHTVNAYKIEILSLG